MERRITVIATPILDLATSRKMHPPRPFGRGNDSASDQTSCKPRPTSFTAESTAATFLFLFPCETGRPT